MNIIKSALVAPPHYLLWVTGRQAQRYMGAVCVFCVCVCVCYVHEGAARIVGKTESKVVYPGTKKKKKN